MTEPAYEIYIISQHQDGATLPYLGQTLHNYTLSKIHATVLLLRKNGVQNIQGKIYIRKNGVLYTNTELFTTKRSISSKFFSL